MHSIEDIIANAQSAVAASLREAYDAGREHQTGEMRDKFVAFFEGVIAPFAKSSAVAPAPVGVAELPAEAPDEPAPAPIEAAAETAPEAVAAEPPAEAEVEAHEEAAAEAAAEAAPAA